VVGLVVDMEVDSVEVIVVVEVMVVGVVISQVPLRSLCIILSGTTFTS
jgi:hypothetical protein